MQIVERIKAAAAGQGLSLAQLEQQLGFGSRTIYKWDKNSPSMDKVIAVANFLHLSLTWLATGTYDEDNEHTRFLKYYELLSDLDKEKVDHFMEISLFGQDRVSSPVCRKLPILGHVCSEIIPEGVHFLGYGYSSLEADYGLIMGDLSMKPLFGSEEYVFLKQADAVPHGHLGVFYIQKHLTCRQFLSRDGCILLQPLNPQFRPQKFSPSEFLQIKVLGKVALSRNQEEQLSLFLKTKSNDFDLFPGLCHKNTPFW